MRCFVTRWMFVFLTLVTSPLHLAVAAGWDATDWPSWRGTGDAGSLEGGQYPSKWSASDTVWSFELPGKGCSTPIVVDKQIYVTCPLEGKDALLAIDWSGKELWNVAFGDQSEGKHRNGSGANPSPSSDGEAIYVNYKSGTLAAVEMDGTIRWQTNLVERFGPDTLFWDHGSSPVLTENDVVIARMHHGESWLAAFDKKTGEIRWKVARNYDVPTECDNGYTTPVVLQHNGKEAILVWGAEHVTIHDAHDGRVLWTCGNFNPEGNKLWPAIASPVVVGNIVVIAYGRNDRGQPRLFGVKLDGAGDVTGTNHVWDRSDIGTFVPTPAQYQGKLYFVRDKGELACVDPQTGKTFWTDALPKHRNAYYASPLIAGGNLYAIREDGVVFVVRLGDNREVLAEINMGEQIIASPVPSDGRLFLRGERHLFCVGG